MIHPLGFEIDDKKLKRAGLDYWDKLQIYEYDNYLDFKQKNNGSNIFYFTTKSTKSFTSENFVLDNVYLMFGRETAGIDKDILLENKSRCLRIPMKNDIRCLNLSNSVAVAAYEVARQNNFSFLK